MYLVKVNDTIVKKYKHKEQAETYCLLKGYIYTGYDEWNHFDKVVVLDPRVKIEHEED